MPSSPDKFFDLAVRPPKNGWTIPFLGEHLNANSEGELIEKMARLRKNNGSYVNEASIEAELWDYFCSREPVRCGKMPHEVAAMSKPLKSREITKELQGGPIWTFLNTLAAVWEEGLHPYFLATCNAIVSILECPDCQREWRLILKETPPSGLKNKLSVCRWVWNAHNTVRRRIGRADYPWEAAVKEWGFPVA